MYITARRFPNIPRVALVAILGGPFLIASCWFRTETVSPTYRYVGTVAGNIAEPFGIAVREDVVYVSDGGSGTIIKMVEGGQPTVHARGLETPSGIALLTNEELVVADTGSHTIKKVAADGSVSILAGSDQTAGDGDGPVGSATFNAPVGVAVGEDGSIYVSDTYNDRIRVIREGIVSTVAGGSRGFADGQGITAKFDTPLGIAVWGDKLLVADSGNRRVRVIDSSGSVTTLAGNGQSELLDGSLSGSGFVAPTAVATNSAGHIFVADGNAVRVIGRRAFPLVETLGGHRRGLVDGNMEASRFNRPSGLAIGPDGNLFVADSDNRAVRVISDTAVASKADSAHLPPDVQLPLASRWPYDPPAGVREVAGTLGEIRGEIGPANKPNWFHNGFDIAGAYGETARFVRDEVVLDPHSVQNFGTSRELLRLPLIGYIHLRLGRDKDDRPFGDARFQFDRDPSGRLIAVRVRRGTKFSAGDAIGTLNAMNHVHLIAGRSGSEQNAIGAIQFPGISDTITPTIEDVSLFDQNWSEIETGRGTARIRIADRTRIVVRAYDRMDGNSERRRLGVYKIGYQVLPAGSSGGDITWTIVFDRMPSNDAVRFAYAPGSKSGYTGETVFNYIASNRLSGDHFVEEFLDPASLSAGKHVLRVFAADFFGNTSSKDIDLEVVK